MYLKSLELQGFKSFPDRIRLTFDEGMTAVVGPNGSGKSNIGDAVRWVLGEQSTKELRGKNMEDVIFSGTSQRKPMGFAAVTLVIDNADGALHNDEPEVAITRKLYRSGDSEYLINGKNVRLKDINELFMDTGLGRDGYAIIGQGRIAEIVGAKSKERRDIFEEAAGVSRFRYKKTEAERKLAAAEENLVRLSDIAQELESRLGPLKTQAEKAEKYLVLAAERKTLEVSFWVHRLGRLTAQLQTLSDEYLRLTAEYDNLQADIAREEEKLQLAYADMQQATVDIETLQNKIVSSEQENAEVTARIAVCETEIRHSNDQIASYQAQQAELSESGDEWEKKLAEQDAYIQELAERQAKLTEELNAQTAALEQLAGEHAAKAEACAAQDSELRTLYLQQSAGKIRIEGMLAERTETEESVRRAEAEGADTEARMKDYRKQEKSLQSQLDALGKQMTEQENRLSGCKQLAALREQKYRKAQEELDAVNAETAKVQQQQRIYRDLEQHMEGYQEGVKRVLKQVSGGRLGGVHGTVSQKIIVEPQYGQAIETALGGALQNIIVENEDAAKRAIRFLKETHGGRATFLPLTTITGSRLTYPGLEGCDGFVALACDLVKFEDKYRSIVENLLGRIAVAEDIDAASAIARQFRYKFRIVTLDGQVVHAGGSYTGGSAARSAGIITRSHALKEAEEKLRTLEGQQASLRDEAAKRKAEWAKLLTDVEGAAARIGELKEQMQGVQQSLTALQARAASDAAWQENEAEQRARLQEKIAQLDANIEEAKKQQAALDAEISEKEKQLRADSVEQTRLYSERELTSQQIAQAQIRQAELAKDVENERRRRISMAQNAEHAANQSAVLDDQIRAEKQSIAAKQKEITMLTEGQALRRSSINEMQTQITALRRAHDEKEQFTRLIREGIDELRDAREKTSAERSRAEERQGTVQKEIDDLVFRLQDSYEMTRSEAEAAAHPIENMREAEMQLSSLKAKIRALGSVNVGAVDEYREVSARYGDLSAQLKDINSAKSDLEALIAQLTSEMCVIFQDSFGKINKYFGEIFAELFGGGTASLELTDPDNVLESGIEIKVAPPGKVIKNLSLLSGGEQAFVAICIYFAILKLRPAPFCMLDEIDAALDEVNVRKYAQYLKNSFAQIQFVVVTHRRSAMDEADVLYGVTMQDGVSRLLRLDQNGAEIAAAE